MVAILSLVASNVNGRVYYDPLIGHPHGYKNNNYEIVSDSSNFTALTFDQMISHVDSSVEGTFK
jgi:hypothetical protein